LVNIVASAKPVDQIKRVRFLNYNMHDKRDFIKMKIATNLRYNKRSNSKLFVGKVWYKQW